MAAAARATALDSDAFYEDAVHGTGSRSHGAVPLMPVPRQDASDVYAGIVSAMPTVPDTLPRSHPAVSFMAALTDAAPRGMLLYPKDLRGATTALAASRQPSGALWQSLEALARSGQVQHRGAGPQGSVVRVCPVAEEVTATDAEAATAGCINLKVYAKPFREVGAAEARNLMEVNGVLLALADNEQQPSRLRAAAREAMHHVPLAVGFDVHAGSGALALGLQDIPLQFVAAPTLGDAIRKGALSWRATRRLLAQVLLTLRLLQHVLPGMRHNDLCVDNVLVARGLRAVIINWGLATTPDGRLASPLADRRVTLAACHHGLCAAPSPIADLHRLLHSAFVAISSDAAVAVPWAADLEAYVTSLFPLEYHFPPFLAASTGLLTGAAAVTAQRAPTGKVARDVQDALRAPDMQDIVRSMGEWCDAEGQTALETLPAMRGTPA